MIYPRGEIFKDGLLIINGIFYLPAYNIYLPSTRCMPAVKAPDTDQRARCAPR
jgi:hypothetical protein